MSTRTTFARSLALLTLAALSACAGPPDDGTPVPEGESIGQVTEALTGVCPPANNVTGVDVASYQHPNGVAIDWKEVAKTRKFAFVKATQGTTYANSYYPGDMTAGRAAGLVMGSYAVIGPKSKTGKTGEQQAQYFLAHSSIKPGDLPPMLDVEPFAEYGSILPDAATVLSWLTTVEKAIGRKPTVYIRPDLVVQLGTPTALGQYTINIPNYSNCPGYPSAYPVKNLVFWQYSSTLTVPGIKAAVDGDRFYGDLAALKAFAGPVAKPDAGHGNDTIAEVSPISTDFDTSGPDDVPGGGTAGPAGVDPSTSSDDGDAGGCTVGTTGARASGISGVLLAIATVLGARRRATSPRARSGGASRRSLPPS